MEKIGNFLLIFLFSLNVLSAQTQVEATVDRNEMSLGEPFTLNIMVSSDGDFELNDLQLPKIEGIELINSMPGGRQSSTSMSIINGKSQFVHRTSQDYNFILSPQKEGSLMIPPIDVKIDGQVHRTNPIKIEVREEFRNGKKSPKGRPKFPPGYGGGEDRAAEEDPFSGMPDAEDLFEQLLKQQQRIFGGGGQVPPNFPRQQDEIPSKNLNVNTNEAFFVHLELSKNEVYEGEQVTANWYIYTRANMESLDRVKFPDLRGFWKEIIEEVPTLQFSEEIVNGVRYRKALLASHALFPIKPGTAIVDEFKIKARVRMPTQFGWGALQEFTKVSKRTEVKVLPLPNEGRTQNFSGAVGRYRVSLNLDGNSFPAHQPFSVKVRFDGFGNAKLIELPTINWPEGLEIYDTKSESKYFKDGRSYKEFEVLVIPRKEGQMKIPSLQFSYFDPDQKKYVVEKTEEIDINITEGQPAQNNLAESNRKPKTEAAFNSQPILQLPQASISLSNYRLQTYFGVLSVGLAIILLYMFLQLKSLKFEPEFLTVVKSRLEQIEKFEQQSDYRRIGSEATNLIYLLVANLAGQKKADQEMHILINEISFKDQELYLQRINQLFDYFQLLGFSPDEVMQAALNKKPISLQIKQLKELAKEIVDKLKKQAQTSG